tara:strand:- start:43 stop:240 length:198 start_codon:yes stop_codon:yes gene_type:complete
MYNVVNQYFKKYPVTTPMGAAYAAELALAGYFAYQATQSDVKYNAVMATAFGLLATGMVVKEGLV